MANKKANMKFNRTLIRSALFLILLLHATVASWGAITNQSVYLQNDLNGDGIAGIGDTIVVSCRSTTADQSQYPYVNLSAIGYTPFEVLPSLGGNLYSAIYTIGVGTQENNTPVSFQFFDEDGVRVGGSLWIDNRRPNSLYGPSSFGATGLGTVYKIGDNLQLDIEMSTAFDSDVPRANLTNIGLGSSHSFSRIGGPDSAPIYRLVVPFPMNREGTATPITVRATDDAGNSRSWDLSVSYDTIVPEVHSVLAVNMTDGKTWVTAGDTIRISATISNYDFDTVRAYNPIFSGGFVNMVRVSGTTPGGEAVYQFDYPVTEAATIAGNFITFEVRAIDNAGNESLPQMSNPLRFDNIPPEFSSSMPMGVRIIKNGGIPNNSIAIIGDDLHFFGSLSSIMTDVTTTVDLTAIGGVANQIIPFNNSATTTFELLYRIHQFTSEDTMPRAFTVTARDTAGNAISQIVLPIIYVDNNPPIISAGQVQNVSRPGQTVRYGDQIAIQANVTNLDGGSVWVNFERIGGTASSTLTAYSGSTYRLDQLVAEPTFGQAYDQTVSFTIFAVDNAGNVVQTVTNNITIDNEPPLVIGSAFSSTPAISATHPYVRVGDRLTFRVQLASSSANVFDGQTVSMNLTEFGEYALVPMVYDGVGSYTLSVDVPQGTLNDEYYFPFTATDNAGNSRAGTVRVKIDNAPPVVGPMTVNFLTDMAKAGAVNIGDRLEFIVPVNEPDSGTGTIDLSLVGGPSSFIMNYDAVLRRYYLVHDCVESAMENPSYVFRAVVSDKAGNTMNSVSPTFEVDCRPPVIEYASATHLELKGNPGVVNVGDRVRIIAKVDLSKLDGGIPTVNLSAIGGSGAQALFDDGANNDGIAGDGIFGYTHTVTAGNTDGETLAFTVQVTDNAGNRAVAGTEALFVDNKPLTISSITNTLIFDNNGNSVVDLDGVYTTAPVVATDVVRLEVNINGNPGDMGNLTVDLTKLGINNTAVNVPFVAVSGGWKASADYSPLPGTTNGEDVSLSVILRDVNGNETLMTATNIIRVDNRPPKIETYPISFVVDNGRLNEANLNDVIQIRVRLSHHNDLLPQIEWTNLYLGNGLTPPSPTLMMPSPTIGGEYIYEWTVPEGLGTVASLTILAYDQNGNMAYAYTNEIRFLSKTPVFANFPQTRADLSLDIVPTDMPNRIANPGDQVTLTAVMTSLYNTSNSPPATVLADIRSIINSPSDDAAAAYNDGDMRTYWTPLTYQPFPISGAGNYVYRSTFTVSAGGVDTSVASFGVRVLHPDASSIILASSTIFSDPDNPFGIDTQVPFVKTVNLDVIDEKNDNIASNSINISDLLRFRAEIERFPDPGSVTAILLLNDNTTEVFRTPLFQKTETSWEAQFEVATWTLTGWKEMNGITPRYRVIVTDDADNLHSRDGVATFTVDNSPPVISNSQLRIENRNDEAWVGNVGDGMMVGFGDNIAPDGLVASVTVVNAADLTGNGRAYIDLSPISGTATYHLNQVIFNTAFNPVSFDLATNTFDLATRTFRIWVRDGAGNKAFVEHELAIDTTRPELIMARYDGIVLTLDFSEPVDQTMLQANLDLIRLGNKMDHSNTQVTNGSAKSLDPASDTIFIEPFPSSTVTIMLSTATKGHIADWGATNVYVSIAHDTTTGEAPAWPNVAWNSPITKDIAGNWLKPIPRTLANFPVTITNVYTTRPNLISARYNANTPSEKDFIYLDFDKDMDLTSVSETTLRNLAIWLNRGDPNDTYANRYRFIDTAASDTIVGLDSPRRLKLRLSEQAQDWIALNYTRAGSQIHMQINGSEYEPPTPSDPDPLIRDFEGNRVTPVTYNNAVAGTLLPLNTSFSIQNSSLDFSGPQPILKIGFQTGPNRRARLYLDPYKNLAETIELSRDLPIDLSRIYLHSKGDLSGTSIPLSATNVDYNTFKTLNTDYASITVHIPLTSEALKTMLTWGTSQFYIACSDGAFRDLWGNPSIRYPVQGNQASPIPPPYNFPIMPAPRIQTVAISPAKSLSAQEIQLFKGQSVGNFFYEVAFETATLSADVYIPIDRTKIPVLQMFTQNDLLNPKDTATFIGWLDHTQGGITRTVARYANNSDLAASQNIQRQPSLIKLKDFADVFGNSTVEETASRAFNLNDKDSSINGFKNASFTMVFDNQPPRAASVIPTGTVGITPAGSMNFEVTFDERMDRTVGSTWQPQLRLGDGSTTVMSFTFQSWVNETTARFVNSGNFDVNTPQGTYTYYISGGFDEAGNRGGNDVAVADQLHIRSKGPVIDSFRVNTFQSTTAKFPSPTGDLTDAPFSPYVDPGIATITVKFLSTVNATSLWLHFYQGDVSVGSIPVVLSGSEGKATWDGTLNGVPIGQFGPNTYVLRIYDDAGNEGSKRGSITYDGLAPDVSMWRFSNVKTYSEKAYFSPTISSFAKIDVFGPMSGQALRMRLQGPDAATTKNIYPMVSLTGGGYTISFDGKNTDNPVGILADGEYMVNLVDLAGNLGKPLGVNGKATSTLVIDSRAPEINSIIMQRADNNAAVTRFNPRVTDLRFVVASTDPTVASGTALVKIMTGSTLMRELLLQGGASPYTVEWNGQDKNLQPVPDGTYRVTITDLAGNESAVSADVTVVNSVFKVTGVTQVDRQTIRVSFSHDVNETDATNPALYTITPGTPAGIGAGSPITVDKNNVTVPLNQVLNHGTLYTLTLQPGYKSADDDPITAGNNTAQFTADTQGPRLTNITYDGLNSQKKFNVVFDEQIDSVTSQQVGNYKLTTGTATVNIESIILRADLKSVTITAFDDITEANNYTIVASGVKDLFGNPSDGDVARLTFQGQDITPPVLTISAFSNPANEFDISVVVKSNEDLSGAPTATITQSGGTAVSLILNAGPNNRMFIGGAHLDMNYPGVATIKVTGRDVSNNVGTSNMSFSTAYVNASARASIKSFDDVFMATFEPGTLKKDSMVAVMAEELVKVSSERGARILPNSIAELNPAQIKSIRASLTEAKAVGDEELIPVGQAYSMNVPAGRIIKPVKLSMKLSEEQIGSSIGLYYQSVEGWIPVKFAVNEGTATFASSYSGTFAMMKDIKAPRASMITEISDKPVREARPTFNWKLEEYASGIDFDSAAVLLNGKIQPVMLDKDGNIARFTPVEDLVGGQYEMSLRISDKAGNQTITESIRFVAAPPLKIQEVVQFPNPARNRVNLRISTNRTEIDWGEVEVNIYDVAGHKVADNSNLVMRASTNGIYSVQDVTWDLRATGGKSVANGVYIARIVVRDPDDWNRKTRYNHKIAVLR